MFCILNIGDFHEDVVSWKLLHKDNVDFLENEYFRQRITINKNIEISDMHVNTCKKDCNIYSSVSKLPKHIFISNNNKNMNLAIMHFWTNNKAENNAHKDSDLLALSLCKKIDGRVFQLSSYKLAENVQIVQTRHNVLYEFCLLEIKPDADLSIPIITLEVIDSLEKCKYTIEIEKNTIDDSYFFYWDKTSELVTKNKVRSESTRFSIEFCENKYPTRAFICDIESDIFKKVKDDIVKENNIIISTYYDIEILLNKLAKTDDINLLSFDQQRIKNNIKEKILDNYVRAITYVCDKIPKVDNNFYRQNQISFAFYLKDSKPSVTCIRSR